MMRKSTLALSMMLLSGTVAAQNSTVTVGTLRADTARVGVIAPKPAQDGGLVLHLPFEADTGATVQDASGNGHNGTAANCVWSSAGRYAGGAMSFNGSNSSVGFPTAPDFPAWGAYSVSVWFKHNGGGYLGGYQYGHKIIDKTSMMHDWHLNLRPDYTPIPGHIALVTYEGGTVTTMWDPSHNYADGVWHHAVIVRDGVVGQLWVDGILKDSTNKMVSVYSTSALCVGNSFSTDSFQRTSWSGLIDEVRIYDRALSPAEIGQLYEDGLLTLPPPSTVVTVTGGLAVGGSLSVTGAVSFAEGVRYCLPLGDLSSGIYTDAP